MKKNEFYFSAADETTKIRAIEWLPESEPKAIFQIFHGVAQPMLCYEELAEFFTGHGFCVIGNEPPVSGTRQRSQEDIHTCLKRTRNKYPDVPHLLLGLSQGATEVRSFVHSNPEAVEGVVLADAKQAAKTMEKNLPVLHVSGVEENRPEVFRHIYRWIEERLDEMLYRAAIKQ